MRAQRRRFVVEVKRGTNRASFISTDAATEKFSSAEDALFGPRTKPAAATPPSDAVPSTSQPMGRVLRDLQEPPPPPLPDLPPPVRRGRKPGSKNKPKPVLATPPAAPARPAVRPLWADAVAAQRTDPDMVADTVPAHVPAEPVSHATPSAGGGEGASPGRRPRLRDRSTILKRYVLGTEPAPGQTGWIRRAKRQG